MRGTIRVAIILAFLGASSGSADQRLNLNLPGGGAQDMLNLTRIPPEISDSTGDPSFKRSCVNSAGREIRQNEEGYADCMAAARGKKINQSRTQKLDPGLLVNPR